MIGTELAHYRITAKLGEGGMGEVWRATDSQARPRGRDQGPAGVVLQRSRAPGALRARGEGPGESQPSAHRGDLRPRGGRGREGAGPRAGRGADARRASGAGTAAARGGARDRPPDRRGARGGARQGDRPPRPEAGERQAHRRRQGEGARLRPRQGARPDDQLGLLGLAARALADDVARRDDAGGHPRHRRLHEPGAGARRQRRPPRRRLGVRRRAVRDALRPHALRRPDGLRHAGLGAQGRARPGAAAAVDAGAHPAAPRTLPAQGRPAAAALDRRRPDHDRGGAARRGRRARNGLGAGGRAAAALAGGGGAGGCGARRRRPLRARRPPGRTRAGGASASCASTCRSPTELVPRRSAEGLARRPAHRLRRPRQGRQGADLAALARRRRRAPARRHRGTSRRPAGRSGRRTAATSPSSPPTS